MAGATLGHALGRGDSQSGVAESGPAIAALRAAGMQVIPVALPRFNREPWALLPEGEGAHLRLRLQGVSLPARQEAPAATGYAGGISADLYLSTWKVVPVRGKPMLLVDLRIMDPISDEPLWSRVFLTSLEELDPLQDLLRQAISEALRRSLDRRRDLLTV